MFNSTRAAFAQGIGVVSSVPIRVKKILQTAVGGAGTATLYNGQDTTGNVAFTFPGNSAIGTVWDVDIPLNAGAYVVTTAAETITVTLAPMQGGS